MIKGMEETVILGAGLSGLSTAYHLGEGYVLFEKESEPGGMARSIHKDGYIFDYDGHLLHFRNDYTFKLISELLSGNIASHKRDAWIYSKDTFTRYPFQANLYGLPGSVVKDCLIGFIKAKLASSGKKGLNNDFETWTRRTFGNGIAEHFMLPYNRKFWTIEPGELTCEWLDGFVPVPALEDVVIGAMSPNLKPYGYNSDFWYPVKGGISELAEAFSNKIRNTSFNKNAVAIDQFRREIIFEDSTIKKFKNLISTIPLPELFNLLTNVPPRVKEAFLRLRFTSILALNFGIRKDNITDRHWIYYPEREQVFYRVGFSSNFSKNTAPPGRTSIYAEISYPGNTQIDRDSMISAAIRDLKKLGIISDDKDIEICMPIDIKYGYVIYDSNRIQATQVIKDYLKRFNISSIGRYGGWSYMSMEDVILQGKETAECLVIS